ncbi:MAG TPA: radical SAM family heme chaperone HemW [Elusimicrobiales bacterium]|nr:radical SAM family heme chaperone HemW [Elusimicrobiales bacterium]
MRGLYVHIPFCRKKCGYCDFASVAGADRADEYLDALEKEAAAFSRLAGSFDTLYVGGGTPSLLAPAQLEKLFSVTARLAGRPAEATFEANPESLDAEKAALLRRSGINRVSLGLQAAQDRLLRGLGRVAMTADFERAWSALRKAGFDNLNADLMCGLPEQSLADFTASLDWLLGRRPEHVSLYALEVHEGTPFFRDGVKEAPDAAVEMYEAAAATLEAAGFRRYEISNFARAGRKCRHNLNYWEQGEYLGLGAAAASYLDGERRTNTGDLGTYLASVAARGLPDAQSRETLEGRARRAEKIMLGLRKTGGIELESDIIKEFSGEIDSLLARDLIEKHGRTIKIKSSRIYLSNAVFREFV